MNVIMLLNDHSKAINNYLKSKNNFTKDKVSFAPGASILDIHSFATFQLKLIYVSIKANLTFHFTCLVKFNVTFQLY